MKRWLSSFRKNPTIIQSDLPWGLEKFSDAMHLNKDNILDKGIRARILLRVIDNYKKYDTCYHQATQSTEREYYRTRLLWLQKWAEPDGFKRWAQAVERVSEMLAKDEHSQLDAKAIGVDWTALQHELNVWGILYESVMASENFYARIHLLDIISFNALDYQNQMEFFKELVEKFHVLYIDIININSQMRESLIKAYESLEKNPEEYVKLVLDVYQMLTSLVKNIDRTEFNILFVKSRRSNSYSFSPGSHKIELSSSVSLPIINSQFATPRNFSDDEITPPPSADSSSSSSSRRSSSRSSRMRSLSIFSNSAIL